MSELVIKNELFEELNKDEMMELEGGWAELGKEVLKNAIKSEIVKSAVKVVKTVTVDHYKNVGKDIKSGKMKPSPIQC